MRGVVCLVLSLLLACCPLSAAASRTTVLVGQLRLEAACVAGLDRSSPRWLSLVELTQLVQLLQQLQPLATDHPAADSWTHRINLYSEQGDLTLLVSLPEQQVALLPGGGLFRLPAELAGWLAPPTGR